MANGFGFSISGESIQKAKDAAEFKMTVPPTARVSTRNADTTFWEEAGTITQTSSAEQIKDGMKIKLLTYEVTCSAEGSGLNIGYPIKTVLRINPGAMATGSPDNQAKMSFMSINKLVATMRGAGIVPDGPDGGYTEQALSQCFPEESSFPTSPSPLVGKTIRFEMKYSPFDGRDGKRRWIPEIVNVFEPI